MFKDNIDLYMHQRSKTKMYDIMLVESNLEHAFLSMNSEAQCIFVIFITKIGLSPKLFNLG